MILTSVIDAICNKDVKKIGLLGLGKSNSALMKNLLEEGWEHGFTLRSDTSVEVPCELDVRNSFFGEGLLSCLCEDILFLSPSVRRTDTLLRAAKDCGCRICSDAELFFSTTPKNVLATTGSDGKSTVTYLCSQLTMPSLGAPPSGNFGLPFCELIKSESQKGTVAELSSFQLSYIKPKLARALITNRTENHLNWHESFREYVSAKTNIFENADSRAIFLADELCQKIALDYKADVIISDKHTSKELYSLYHPMLTVTREHGHICINGNEYIPTDVFLRSEGYDIINFMCAIALGDGYTDKECALECAKSFCGLPHRKESFLYKNGVTYVNSSIDSTPQRTATTLSTLQDKAIVIVGGGSKGLSYAPLTDALTKHAKAIILTGESTPTLFALLRSKEELADKVFVAQTFESAAELAVGIARYGDTVILSPAHTSFDRFRNFEHRGEYFKKIIREITN